MMLKEGLNVISSNCNKIDGRFIYTIRSEVWFLNLILLLICFFFKRPILVINC
jgi:hypothetical protein